MGVGANIYGFYPKDVNDENLVYFEAAASQTWVKGDMLYLVSGKVTLATSSSATLLGPAADDRTSTAANESVPVWSRPYQIYRVRASADPSSLVTGDLIDLTGGTGEQEANVAASTTDVFYFIRIADIDDVTDEAGTYIYVCIAPAKHEFTQ